MTLPPSGCSSPALAPLQELSKFGLEASAFQGAITSGEEASECYCAGISGMKNSLGIECLNFPGKPKVDLQDNTLAIRYLVARQANLF